MGNFAACHHDCYQGHWGVANNAVNHHLTMYYTKSTQHVEVYHCTHGASTCGRSGSPSYIHLSHFGTNGNPDYVFVADIWNSQPSAQFVFEVTNLRIFTSKETA